MTSPFELFEILTVFFRNFTKPVSSHWDRVFHRRKFLLCMKRCSFNAFYVPENLLLLIGMAKYRQESLVFNFQICNHIKIKRARGLNYVGQ